MVGVGIEIARETTEVGIATGQRVAYGREWMTWDACSLRVGERYVVWLVLGSLIDARSKPLSRISIFHG